jgi:hypothetical protein
LRSRIRLSFVRRGAVVAVALLAMPAAIAGATQSDAGVCGEAFQAALSAVHDARLPDGRHPAWLARGVTRAMTLFRFDRSDDALQKLDSALQFRPGPWGSDVPRHRREHERVLSAAALFRTCIAAAQPDPMATVTIRLYQYDDTKRGGRGRPAEGPAYIDVDGLRAGQTAADGSVTLRVPSGKIRLEATLYPSSWAEESVTLAAGETRTVSIVLADSKEPAEDSALVLAEATDDIVPVASPSFTLRFMSDDGPVGITHLWRVELQDLDGNLIGVLDEMFIIREGAIVAPDPPAVFAALTKQFAETVILVAHAEDAAGRTHANEVRFRVGQFRLGVTLSPPPSNPAVPVSNVEVFVSVVGTAIRVRAVSDATGRFEIASLPHGTLAFDSETVAEGKHYYGQATMPHSSDRSVTLVMRHVSDVVKGVPALR